MKGRSYLSTVENILSPHLSFFYLLPDGLAHFVLILVDVGPINVPVPYINGSLHWLCTGPLRGLKKQGGEEEKRTFPLIILHQDALHIDNVLQQRTNSQLHVVIGRWCLEVEDTDLTGNFLPTFSGGLLPYQVCPSFVASEMKLDQFYHWQEISWHLCYRKAQVHWSSLKFIIQNQSFG